MKNNFVRKSISVMITLMLTVLLMPTLGISASATVYAETVNLAYADQHVSGDGYYWDNVKKVLTLDNLEIDTDDDFGLRLPDNATIELKGTSRISAEKYALGCPGNVTVKGKGSLILESDEAAIFVHSRNDAHKFRVFSGSISAKSKGHALISESAEISVTGGKLELISEGAESVSCRVFAVTAGSVKAEGTVHATHLIRVNEAEVEVFSKDGAALKSDNLYEFDNMKLLAGNDSSKLSEKESYTGEKYFTSVPVPKGPRSSILFGEGTPITVDYVLLALAVVLTVAVIVLPVMRKRIKTRKLYEALEAEREAKKAESK